MKKLICALLIMALCACALAGCKRRGNDEAAPGSDAPSTGGTRLEVTAVPEEGSHGEQDQSGVLADMPTLAPAETLEPGAAPEGEGEAPEEAGDSGDYFSVDDLIGQTEEFETYDEAAQPQPPSTQAVIDPNTIRFSALSDESLGFTFNYPSDWVNVPGIFTVCYREVVEPGDFPARVAISGKRLVHSPEGTVVTDELTSFVRAIYKQYDAKTFQLGTLNTQDTFLGRQAYSNTYLAYSGETEVKGFIIGCTIGRNLFVFHFCASYEDYTALERVMRYMLNSVQPLQKDE